MGKFTFVMVRLKYRRCCIVPPSDRSVFPWMPYSVPTQKQLLTTRLLTPPSQGWPIDKPCPLPNVQLEIVILLPNAELLPIWMLSSPSLMEQLRISTLVEAKSIPSVLCVPSGVLIVMF